MSEISQEENVLIDVPNELTASENVSFSVPETAMHPRGLNLVSTKKKLFSPPNAENLSKRIRLQPHQVRPTKRIEGGGPVAHYGKHYRILAIKCNLN